METKGATSAGTPARRDRGPNILNHPSKGAHRLRLQQPVLCFKKVVIEVGGATWGLMPRTARSLDREGWD